jgi:Tfp pilus assembly protein PilO
VSRNYRILFCVVAIAAVAGGYWKLVLAPKRADAAKLSNDISITQAELDQAKTTLASYQQAKSEYRDNYAKIIRLGKAVPADDDTRSLMVQVDTAAKRSGVDFDNIDLVSGSTPAAGSNVATATDNSGLPPGAVNGGSFAVMPFSLAFSGKFDTLSNFFSRLERFVTLDGQKIAVDGRLLRIERIELKPIDNGWPAVQANVDVSSFVVPRSDPAAGATTTTTGGTSTSTSSSASDTTSPTSSNPGSDLR